MYSERQKQLYVIDKILAITKLYSYHLRRVIEKIFQYFEIVSGTFFFVSLLETGNESVRNSVNNPAWRVVITNYVM